MQMAALLARFDGVSEQPDGGYLAHCPAHADGTPSLRLWFGEDGRCRLTCRAGCATRDVIAAAKLDWPDLFDVGGADRVVAADPPALVSGEALYDLAGYLAGAKLAGDCDADAAAYMGRRFGLTVDQASALGIGYDDGSGTYALRWRSAAYTRYPRIVVPLVGFDGVARGAQGRDISGKCPMRWVGLTNPPGQRWAPYGVLQGGGGYPVVVVTEGPGDGLTAAGLGYDVILIRGAGLAGNPEMCREIANGVQGKQVIAAGDADDAGLRFNAALADGLRPYGVPVHGLGIPDHGPKTDITRWREANPEGFPSAFHSAIRAAQVIVPAQDSGDLPDAAGNGGAAGSVVRDENDGNDSPADVVERLAQRYGPSDTLNAYVLAALNPGQIKWTPGLGYMAWNGKFWERGEHRIRQLIHAVGASLGEAAKSSGDKDLMRTARGFTVTRHINDLLRELRAVPEVFAETADFDARPELLSFANGTVDLRSGTLGPHDPAHMLTYALAIDYVPGASAERWVAFLAEIFVHDPELADYIQRLVGYAITGSTAEQCFAVLYGTGANGKSVLTDVLTYVFRAVVRTTPFATFEARPSGGIPNDIAALYGSRLVMASEGESGKPMSEAILKRLSGKDMISARFLNKEFFEFKPSFLIMLATNFKPNFRGQDEGLWRRVKLIPFRRYFAPAERDPDLDAKLCAEAEGIAAWAVAGAVAWYAGGLRDPKVIRDEVQEYKETSDALAGFFPGVLAPEEGARMEGVAAFSAYLDWTEAEHLQRGEQWKRGTFYSAMAERGIEKKRGAKGVVLVGCRLADEPAAGPGIFGKDG